MNSELNDIEAIIFDLDYTLYDADQYVRAAHDNVAKAIADFNKLDRERLLVKLNNKIELLGIMHDKLFNSWLQEAKLSLEINLPLAIKSFHEVPNLNLSLYLDVEIILRDLKNNYKIAILTDGKSSTQKRKVQSLGLNFFDSVVYTGDLGVSKPNMTAFDKVIKELNIHPSKMIMVGDHPEKDIKGALQAGMHAIRIKCGAFSSLPDVNGYIPDVTICDFKELKKIL